MESPQALKARLRAVKNIGQITRAMEVVSATKMRKAQELALASRAYALKALEILAYIDRNLPKTADERERAIQNTLVIIVSSDRGLAGAFNTQIFRRADQFFASDPYRESGAHQYRLLAIGKKAGQYAAKKSHPLERAFSGFGDYTAPEEIEEVERLAIDGFHRGRWDRVVVISTHFRSTLRQDSLVRQMLPVDFEKIKETVEELIPETGRYAGLERHQVLLIDKETEYIFEPTREEALQVLIPHLLKMQLYHLMLEANASEHSARRVAMKTASDNAKELSEGLTLEYNKARQASITKEIIEIVSTQSALA